MVKIRLSRTGRKNKPSYRVVVADARTSRDGRNIEILGHYNPLGEKEFKINKGRYKHWIEQGAQPSKTVERLVASKIQDS